MRRALLWIAILAVTGGVVIAGAYLHFKSWSQSPLAYGQSVTIHLEPGQALDDLITHLEQAEVLSEPLRMRLLGRVSGASTRLRIGEYLLTPGMTPEEILNKITEGDVVTHLVRLPEGVPVMPVLARLRTHPVLIDDLPEVKWDAAGFMALAEHLTLQSPFVEGAFLPESYQVHRGDTVSDVLVRAHDAMLNAAETAWAERNDRVAIDDVWQLLILASIVEKETGHPGERHQISQVFHERLRRNMRLQTDPTIIYALGEAFDGDIRRADLQIDSPFNTYRVRGLPPTPITLPSIAALQAAAQPAPGDFLYFVAKGDGSSQFSRTLEAHNAAVRRYQLQR